MCMRHYVIYLYYVAYNMETRKIIWARRRSHRVRNPEIFLRSKWYSLCIGCSRLDCDLKITPARYWHSSLLLDTRSLWCVRFKYLHLNLRTQIFDLKHRCNNNSCYYRSRVRQNRILYDVVLHVYTCTPSHLYCISARSSSIEPK